MGLPELNRGAAPGLGAWLLPFRVVLGIVSGAPCGSDRGEAATAMQK